MRCEGPVLDDFAWSEHEILVAKDERWRALEDVEPFVALVGLWLGYCRTAAGGDDAFVVLQTAGTVGQRQECRSVAGERAQVDTRITSRHGSSAGSTLRSSWRRR